VGGLGPRFLFIANLLESDLAYRFFHFAPSPPLPTIIKENSRFDFVANFLRRRSDMVAVAAEGPIRGAGPVQPAAGQAANGGDAAAAAGKEEVRDYASDMRKLEELLSKLNPSAEEFVPPSRRRGDGRRLSADAPVFVSPAIDYYARHHPVLPQPQPMHVLQLVGAANGGVIDSSSDGSANGQPNRRVIAELPSPIRFGLSPGRGLDWGACGWIDRSALGF
jgi:hypothetical protein